jgi:putative nucleotidyltransferase with HDIG domain
MSHAWRIVLRLKASFGILMADYVPIRVSTLRGDLKIPFNAYVRVAGKYILLCREGDSFEGGRLDRLKSKKLQKMFIPADQLGPYNDYLRQNLEQAYENTKHKPLDLRTQVIQGSLQSAAEDLIEDTESQAFYQVALEASGRFKKFFLSEPNTLAHMLNQKNLDFSVAHHSVVVSALSLAICSEMKLMESYPMKMEPMTVGALLHDIEHCFNNINFAVPPEQLTQIEKTIYNRHAIEGAKRIAEIHFYDKLVLDIINYHEEKIDGSGQHAMREKDLSPLVFVVATANAFDHLLLYQNMTPKDALKKMLIEKMGVFPLDCMKGLQEALKNRGVF